MFHRCNDPILFGHFEHLELPRCCIVTWHLLAANSKFRRISCHGKNHSHTRCEYSETIFLCYHHYSEYSLLGSKFSTNLLFAAGKCHVTIQQQWQFKMFKMAEGSDGCSETIAGSLYKEKRLQRKMTKDNYWIGVQEIIGMFGKS